jgi:thiol:disulfide interchange protein
MSLARLIAVSFLVAATGLTARAASNSADAPHLHLQLLTDTAHLDRAESGTAGLYFKLEQGWHIYWKNAGDSGEPPHVRWTLPAGITAGPMQFPAPRRLPMGPLMDYGYEGEVLFPVNLKVAEKASLGPAKLHANVDWIVCREVCIPGKAELEVTRNVEVKDAGGLREASPDATLWLHAWKPIPDASRETMKSVFQSTDQGFRLAVTTGQRESTAEFFPEDEDVLDNPAPQKLTPTPDGFVLDLKKETNLATNPAQLKGVLELSGGRAYEIIALPGAVAAAPATTGSSSSRSPWAALLRATGLAFLGGMLLNLMPCVFPVLFIKGLALVRSSSEERQSLRRHGFVYAAGILVSFWLLVGALEGLRAAGSVLGWGFQFQSPAFLALMASLLFFLGLSLAGQFEIGLTLTSAGSGLAAKQGYAGSFFTGVLAVVVATPCTAPLMGAAIGYALAQNAVVTFAIFTALALGLAAPYVALTLQPAWTRWMPKPGAWMEVLRQAVSVPIFATVIWLAWVLAQSYGAGLLAALLTGFLLLAIAGWFLGRWPARRWAASVAVLILLAAAALEIAGPRITGGTAENTVGSISSHTASSSSYSAAVWEPWSAEAVSRYQAEGRPVFVDFTAKWCLSCQYNERVALNQPQVQQAFQSAHVALLKADWTRHDTAITQALAGLGRSGVPTYALYSPGESQPLVLTELLTPATVINALKELPNSHSTATR